MSESTKLLTHTQRRPDGERAHLSPLLITSWFFVFFIYSRSSIACFLSISYRMFSFFSLAHFILTFDVGHRWMPSTPWTAPIHINQNAKWRNFVELWFGYENCTKAHRTRTHTTSQPRKFFVGIHCRRNRRRFTTNKSTNELMATG